ncbi:hypothetical protein MTR_1g093170 [Medicago truncatula]|uniref:Uncharacterized protein n=1 Tax=Medicago truncatula TaxID=3880 RepID=G7I474_MEDTR|nr:hypothetical protein MTR_1g093170 [Medicago truncatula]
MGLEMLEEFRPITPIRTIALMTKTLKHVSEVETTEKVLKEDEQECQTPTSSRGQIVVTRINKNSAPPSQVFFQVPHDLASVFVFRKPNIKGRNKEEEGRRRNSDPDRDRVRERIHIDREKKKEGRRRRNFGVICLSFSGFYMINVEDDKDQEEVGMTMDTQWVGYYTSRPHIRIYKKYPYLRRQQL